MSAAEAVVVGGSDALSYLDSQCSQDLSGLRVGDPVDALVCAPNGAIVAFVVVHRVDEGLVVEVPIGVADAVVARLERFAIRADVSFVRGALEAPDPRWRDEASRVVSGLPGVRELARELVPHALVPALRSTCVSFTKGCYPGQELVARMEARHATPPYVLRGLAATTALEVGDPLGDEALDGAVTSAVAMPDGTWRGLGVLHRRDADGEDVVVRAASGTVVARVVGGPSVRS